MVEGEATLALRFLEQQPCVLQPASLRGSLGSLLLPDYKNVHIIASIFLFFVVRRWDWVLGTGEGAVFRFLGAPASKKGSTNP